MKGAPFSTTVLTSMVICCSLASSLLLQDCGLAAFCSFRVMSLAVSPVLLMMVMLIFAVSSLASFLAQEEKTTSASTRTRTSAIIFFITSVFLSSTWFHKSCFRKGFVIVLLSWLVNLFLLVLRFTAIRSHSRFFFSFRIASALDAVAGIEPLRGM